MVSQIGSSGSRYSACIARSVIVGTVNVNCTVAQRTFGLGRDSTSVPSASTAALCRVEGALRRLGRHADSSQRRAPQLRRRPEAIDTEREEGKQTVHERDAQDLAVARRVVKVDDLPLLGSGKIDYVTLTQWSVQ